MLYHVNETELPQIKFASIRFKGHFRDLALYFRKLYDVVQDRAKGAPFTCYYTSEYGPEMEFEVCVPVKDNIYEGDVKTSFITKTKALSACHYGSYNTLGQAHVALFNYARTLHYVPLLPLVEVYERNIDTHPGITEEESLTRLYLPVKSFCEKEQEQEKEVLAQEHYRKRKWNYNLYF